MTPKPYWKVRRTTLSDASSTTEGRTMPTKRKKREDGRYQASVTYTDPQTGERRRHVFYGQTQREASQKAQDARGRVRGGGPVVDSTRTLTDWLAEWEHTFLAVSDRAEATKDLYTNASHWWIKPEIGHIALDRLRAGDIARLFAAMQARGLSGSTQRNAYAALRLALDDAVANDLLMTNPAHKIKRPRASTTESRALDPDEVKAFLDGSKSLRHARAFRLLLATGLRRGELLGLHWSDVDLAARTARIRWSLVERKGALMLSEPKTRNSVRTIFLSDAAVALLREQRAKQNEERLRAANLWVGEDIVFATETGGPVDPRNLSRAMRLAVKKSALDPDRGSVGVHTLRHTYATTALLQGVPLHVVSRSLGHSSTAITSDIYGHLTAESSREAAAAVSTALGL